LQGIEYDADVVEAKPTAADEVNWGGFVIDPRILHNRRVRSRYDAGIE
jgi:hypothetical protein